MTMPTTTTQAMVAWEASPAVMNLSDPGEADTDENDLDQKRISADLAVYSATSLMVGVSAPGLTSAIRGGNAKAKRKLSVPRGGRGLGSPR